MHLLVSEQCIIPEFSSMAAEKAGNDTSRIPGLLVDIRNLKWGPSEYEGEVLRTALFWAITQRVVVIFTDVSGQLIGPIIRVKESDRLSRNVGTKLPRLAA